MYNILIATGKVLVSVPTKELVIIAGSYLASKLLDKKKVAKNLAK